MAHMEPYDDSAVFLTLHHQQTITNYHHHTVHHTHIHRILQRRDQTLAPHQTQKYHLLHGPDKTVRGIRKIPRSSPSKQRPNIGLICPQQQQKYGVNTLQTHQNHENRPKHQIWINRLNEEPSKSRNQITNRSSTTTISCSEPTSCRNTDLLTDFAVIHT